MPTFCKIVGMVDCTICGETFGEKISFLSKNMIMKLSKEIGKSNQISFYFVNKEADIYILSRYRM